MEGVSSFSLVFQFARSRTLSGFSLTGNQQERLACRKQGQAQVNKNECTTVGRKWLNLILSCATSGLGKVEKSVRQGGGEQGGEKGLTWAFLRHTFVYRADEDSMQDVSSQPSCGIFNKEPCKGRRTSPPQEAARQLVIQYQTVSPESTHTYK